MKAPIFNFYDNTSLKSYNLDKQIRYELNLLDTLDVYTRKHCENVASITCRLCEYLHCSRSFTVFCTTCAYLHDIGKLFVPPHILQKTSALDEKEFEIMKKHTINGYNLCHEDLTLRPYAATALNHHEALDGSGYPNGLTQGQIPLEAQIVRVADIFDALVSKRQYKTHINISDALKMLIQDATPINKKSKLISENTSKSNPRIVKKLFKVVLDDIYYEIYCTNDYVKYLKFELDRFKTISDYEKSMYSAKKSKDKDYFKSGMELLFKDGETMENYKTIYNEYKEAYILRKHIIDNLYKEIKIIKKLKI
ncbi:MAG: HD domain-containing protein [Clostridia bacterium]|nr:HD domain-containing protein [Clostridia bacterium]